MTTVEGKVSLFIITGNSWDRKIRQTDRKALSREQGVCEGCHMCVRDLPYEVTTLTTAMIH